MQWLVFFLILINTVPVKIYSIIEDVYYETKLFCRELKFLEYWKDIGENIHTDSVIEKTKV